MHISTYSAQHTRYLRSVVFFGVASLKSRIKVLFVVMKFKLCGAKTGSASLPEAKEGTAYEAWVAWLRSYDRTSADRPNIDQVGVPSWAKSKGWDIDYPLHYAGICGDVEAIKNLIRSGYDPDSKMVGVKDHGLSDGNAMHWAAGLGHLPACVGFSLCVCVRISLCLSMIYRPRFRSLSHNLSRYISPVSPLDFTP